MSTTRRELILGAVGAVAAQPLQALAAPRLQVRIWPGDESTRISVESDRKLKYSYMVLRGKKPYRLVLDLEGLRLNANIEKTLKNFNSSDKFIAGIRPGQFKPNILRIVFDLKDDVRADVNYSKPIAQFGHRIIIDLEATNADTMREVIARTGANEEPAKEVKREQSKPNTVSETQRVTKKKPPKKSGKTETLVVVIDAGHGGEDPGAIGKRRKTYEKTVVLAIAKKLEAQINRTRGMRAVMTRTKDVFLPLHKRSAVAVKQKAHIFVSIHADAWIKPEANGSSVFTLSVGGASSLQARWLAQTQNRADEIGGTVFKDVASQARSTVVDMLAETKLRYGIQLGDEVLSELAKLGPLHKSSVEYAEFAVLKAQGVPSILVETAFLSNPKEENRLRDSRHQARLANAIFTGIRTAVRKDPSILKQT